MKRFYSLVLGSTLALAALLALVGLMRADRVGAATTARARTAPAEISPKELVIGLGDQPASLFIYDADGFGNQVLYALQDGPIDSWDFNYHPVILTKLPSVADGDARLSSTLVFSGDMVVSGGDVVTYTGPMTVMDQLIATFTLRSDVRWCDGQLLTAQDSVFSFEVQRSMLDSIDDPTLVERTYTYTQMSTFTVRWVGLPGYVAGSYVANFWTPLPYHVLSSTPPLSISTSGYERAPLGWGPFCFTEWTSDHITLDRNPFYWQAGLPKLDRLTFRWDTTGDALLDDIVAGRVHLGLPAGGLDGHRVQALDAAGTVQGYLATGTVWEHIDFNLDPIDAPTHTTPFGDVRVRQAIAYGTDRQRIIDEFWYGVGTPPAAYIPEIHPAYPTATVQTYPYSPTLAAALLDDAGWTVMTGGMRYKDGQLLAFVHRSTDAQMRQDIGAIFQENMRDLGISVTLAFSSPSEFFADGPDGPVFGRWFDTAEYAWLFDLIDPPGDLYLCDEIPGPEDWFGFNVTGYCNPAYNAAVDAAMAALTRTEALAHWRTAITTFTQDLPALPLHFRVNVAAASRELVGFDLTPTDPLIPELWNVEVWDIAASETISPDGGVLVSNSGGTTVTFPSGAVSDTVDVILVPQSPPPDPPPGLGTTSRFFELEAVDPDTGLPIGPFGAPVSVTVHYNDAEVGDLFEETLVPYRWTGSEWEKIGTRQGETFTLDIAKNLITLELMSFSKFGHMGLAINQRLYLPLVFK